MVFHFSGITAGHETHCLPSVYPLPEMLAADTDRRTRLITHFFLHFHRGRLSQLETVLCRLRMARNTAGLRPLELLRGVKQAPSRIVTTPAILTSIPTGRLPVYGPIKLVPAVDQNEPLARGSAERYVAGYAKHPAALV